jgi:hypothetical protein
MKLPQLSLARMMVFIGIVAANIAAIRGVILAHEEETLFGILLAAITLQVALFRLVRARGPARAFWVGYIAVCLLTMMNFVRAMMHPEVVVLTPARTLVRIPGSAPHAVWHGYFDYLSGFLVKSLPFLSRALVGGYDGTLSNDLLIAGLRCAIWFLPQLFFALLGGLLARAIAGRRRTNEEPGRHLAEPAYA